MTKNKKCFVGNFENITGFSHLHSLQARPRVLALIFFAVYFKHIPYPLAPHFMLFVGICKLTHGARGRKLVYPEKPLFLSCAFHPENVTSCCCLLTFSRAPGKKDFLFFLWGDPVQNRPQKPSPCKLPFLY